MMEQGKPEGFDSCDRPSNLTQKLDLMDDPKKQ